VDAVLVEGAVANAEHNRMIRLVRARSRVLVSFGDCAVTGNVTSLRNPLGGAEVVVRRSYLDPANDSPQLPLAVVPPLLDVVRPVHQVVPVDVFLPGCPPSAAKIRQALESLVAGRLPELYGEQIRFG